MGRKSYTNEFKAEVSEFYQTHTVAETVAKYGVSDFSIVRWAKKLGYPAKHRGPIGYDDDIRHKACQYYENHTGVDTCAKFGIAQPTLAMWRRELGYRNKHFNFNLYTEQLQPTVTKRERRNFVMTKAENGQLQGELMEIKLQYAVLEREFRQLKETIMEAIQ